MPHKRGKRPRYVVEVEDPGGNCSLSTPSELGTAQKELGLDATVLCSSIHLCLSSYKTELCVNGTVLQA